MSDLLKKLSGFSIGPVVAALISFVTVPIITRYISTEEYGRVGMFTVAQNMVTMVVYLGMDQAFVREFNKYREDKSKLMTNAIALPLLFSLIISGVCVIMSRPLSVMLYDNTDEIMPMIALAIMIPFIVIHCFAFLSIRMQEKGILYSFFIILIKVSTLVITILLLVFYQKSFRSVIYALVAAEVIVGILLIIYTFRDTRFDLSLMDRELLVRMLKFGGPLIPAAMLSWVLSSADRVLLRTLTDYSELGLYEAASKISSLLGIFQSWFTLFWVPVAYRWHEEKKSFRSFAAITKIIAVVMTGICAGVLVFKNVIGIILGDDFVASIYVFPFLMLYPIMYTVSESIAVGINFSRKTAYNIIVTAIAGVFNLALNYMLIPVFAGKGAAMAAGLSYVVFLWSRVIIARKLWWKFPLNDLILCTFLVIINCGAHTFIEKGVAPYIVSGITIVGLCIYLLVSYSTLKCDIEGEMT